MLRPRDSHDLRLVGAELSISPPGKVRWLHDVFGNSVALVDFHEPAAELTIASTLNIERYALARLDFPIAPEAESYPFMHSADDRSDLGRLRERHYPDARGVVEEWARQFILETPTNTFNLLATMNAAIRGSFAYRVREEEGTQTPVETIEKKSGTCRDYALLLIEARAFARLRSALRHRLSLRSGARRRRRRCRARARRMPGPRSICPAPAGSSSIRPTDWSRARTSFASR